ncbi:YdcF family protein [Aerococcaceae bacterium DSM 111021]|nr:YdcF family protein [Aerococcaceae bacterium DSM 111021]
MLLYGIAIVFLMLFLLSFVTNYSWLQPSALALYGMNSFLMGLILQSNWTPVFMFRYFLYIVSGFFIAAVPFVLLLIAVLAINKTVKQPSPKIFRTIFNLLLAFTLLIFVGATIWALLRLNDIQIQEIIGIYIYLSIYFVGTFLCYICLNFAISLWSRGKQATILLVLGSQLDDIDNVTNVLRRRLDKAVQVYYKQKSQTQSQVTIIVTGGPQHQSTYSEAEGMENYLIQKGIPAEDIILEPYAKNTDENFTNASALIKKHRLSGKVTVITSRFHLMRSNYIARQSRFKAYYQGAGTPIYLWPFSIIREYVAYILLTRELNYAFIILLIAQGLFEILN